MIISSIEQPMSGARCKALFRKNSPGKHRRDKCIVHWSVSSVNWCLGAEVTSFTRISRITGEIYANINTGIVKRNVSLLWYINLHDEFGLFLFGFKIKITLWYTLSPEAVQFSLCTSNKIDELPVKRKAKSHERIQSTIEYTVRNSNPEMKHILRYIHTLYTKCTYQSYIFPGNCVLLTE